MKIPEEGCFRSGLWARKAHRREVAARKALNISTQIRGSVTAVLAVASFKTGLGSQAD